MRKKLFYTTGQVAMVCKVCPKKAAQWCNAGVLRSYRLPKVGTQEGHRRIIHEDLMAFIEEHKLPNSIVDPAVKFSPDCLWEEYARRKQIKPELFADARQTFLSGMKCVVEALAQLETPGARRREPILDTFVGKLNKVLKE